ncbi:hypothetical protein ACN4EK_22020 [Pantanalinema rosaneae CENA516]|uniref:hypothetical protein n=1 Tax=Pantanalinema rosaneae TaxID=1620701 RepID=UPI003D6F41DD
MTMQRSEDTNLTRDAVRIDLTERIESLKAGILGAVAAALAFGLIVLGNDRILASQLPDITGLPTAQNVVSLVISGAIAKLSGFLFGVTYRYIIRQDKNAHLKSGAVLAFGLVRGLAQVDIAHPQTAWLPLVLMIGESILLFTIVRLILDWALGQKWVKPFQSL